MDCLGKSSGELKKAGALLLSYSKTIDVGLYRFRRKSAANQGEQFLTTTSVSVDTEKRDPALLTRFGAPVFAPHALARTYSINKWGPETGTEPADYEYVGYEGPIYALNTPDEVPARRPGRVPLVRCINKDGEPVTVVDPHHMTIPGLEDLNGCTPIGLIQSPKTPANPALPPSLVRAGFKPTPDILLNTPLYLWKYTENTASGPKVHYATATELPSPLYSKESPILLGYMPPLGWID